MTETEKSYIAGLFDGEGCVSVSINNNYCRVQLSIWNTNKEVIEYCQKTCGFGAIYLKRKRGRNKREYVFSIPNQDGPIFIKWLLPYLIIKRERAEIYLKIIECYGMRTLKKERVSLGLQLAAINKGA